MKLKENLEKETFTKGMGMTTLHCDFHGHNLGKNGVWRRSIFNSRNGNLWTGDKEPAPRKRKHKLIVSSLLLTHLKNIFLYSIIF